MGTSLEIAYMRFWISAGRGESEILVLAFTESVTSHHHPAPVNVIVGIHRGARTGTPGAKEFQEASHSLPPPVLPLIRCQSR